MTQPNSIEWEDHYEEIPEFTKMVESSTHPEMQDIDPNEEFIIMKFMGNKELQDRIDKLKDSL